MADPRAVLLTLSNTDRSTLQNWTRRRSTAQGLALRARIVLACAEPGATNLAVAARLGISNLTVGKWQRRFAQQSLKGLTDAPRSGVPRSMLDEHIERVITTMLESTPRNATHWSTRLLAREPSMSQTAISRIWRAFALAPDRSEIFKLSTDPHFIDKVRNIVGLYVNPPDRALVLCVDEKPSIQAIEGTAPMLPMRPGQLERHTHDYVPHGTTDLFAALDVRAGTVIGEVHRRHRSVDFRHFLATVDAPHRPGWTCTWCWTTPARTRLLSYRDGWCAIRACICTSRPPRRHGSTWWSAGFLSSLHASCGAANFIQLARSSQPSAPTLLKTMPTPNPLSGPSQPMTFLTLLQPSANDKWPWVSWRPVGLS